jgi:tryptophan-specific transport protein
MKDSNLSKPDKAASIIYGAAVIFSTAVGVGMMSLPIVSVGMWFSLSVVVIILTAFYVISAGSLILEVSMRYPQDTGIHTMVDSLLGKRHAFCNASVMLFNGYILLYAYLTAGSEAIQFYVEKATEQPLGSTASGLLFALIFSFILFLRPLSISRFLSIFITLMILSFIYVAYSLAIKIDLENLVASQQGLIRQFSLAPYAVVALPFFAAALGYQQTIPMLRNLYNNDATKVFKAIILGVCGVATLYLCWLTLTMGNQTQTEMITKLSSGNNRIEDLVSTLSHSVELKALMFLFVQLAVVTSFIGVAKGVLDYLTDIFVNHLQLSSKYAKVLVILPPLTMSLLFPYGFLLGIGFAGLTGAIWGGLYPSLLALKIEQKPPLRGMSFKTPGGRFTPWFTLLFSLVIVAAILLSLFDLLPQYPAIEEQ